MAKESFKRGDVVRVTGGPDTGRTGTIVDLGPVAHAVRTPEGDLRVSKAALELVAARAPLVRPFQNVDNPDGWSAVDPAQVVALSLPGSLSERLFRHHGRVYLAARGLAPADVAQALAPLESGALGLHVSQLGTGPGLASWLAWPHLQSIVHLSFAAAHLGAAATEALLRGLVGGCAQTLDLSVCDVGRKGLKALHDAPGPALRELYLGANPDFDRGRYDARALDVLLAPKNRGAALGGLKSLGLLFWDLSGAGDLLAQDEIVAGLETLWVGPGQRVPDALAGRTIVDWERRPYVGA